MFRRIACRGFFGLALSALSLPSFGFAIGHHGGIILNCTAPVFFDESPAKDAKVRLFDTFSFTASENTDPETLHVWVNNQPVAVAITPERSGRLHVQGTLPQPIISGRVWIKVTGVSDDGCDDIHNWYVQAGQ